MDEIDKEQLYSTAWRHWGAESQINMCIEEMAGFIRAILGTRRNNVTYSYAFSEGMADVLICLEQIESQMKKFPTADTKNGELTITGNLFDQVLEIKERKLLRLQQRLIEDLKKKCDGIGDQALDLSR